MKRFVVFLLYLLWCTSSWLRSIQNSRKKRMGHLSKGYYLFPPLQHSKRTPLPPPLYQPGEPETSLRRKRIIFLQPWPKCRLKIPLVLILQTFFNDNLWLSQIMWIEIRRSKRVLLSAAPYRRPNKTKDCFAWGRHTVSVIRTLCVSRWGAMWDVGVWYVTEVQYTVKKG